ncbi:probable phospholipid-transporting ATPase Neo1p [[Candida] railenensis]|uniref:Phospholipid-transporting ATPase n=1 Tax=[Candida] railenensis TaxID=45579 RepID=A0A9P0VVT2_9ASCO|nr:probable phospholipid-transporting ATPase Neo1p [[Candida] railenensis]
MSRYSFSEESSFDDLDNSLDKALRNASQNVFNYTKSNNTSRNNSQGSGIPLTNMVGGPSSSSSSTGPNGGRKHRDSNAQATASNLHSPINYSDEENDNSPLMSNQHRSFNTSSPLLPSSNSSSSLNMTSGPVRSFKRLITKSIASILPLNKSISLPTTGSTSSQLTEERYVSPKTNKSDQYASNAVSNAKYNPVTFIPIILYEQFKFFFNLYFLLVALSQAIPQLRIGYLSSYIVPLGFVLTVTMLKEATDDIARRRRDKEQNNELYEVINRASTISNEVTLIKSKDLKVGDLVRLHKDSRIPADMILLQCTEQDGNGESFIKTDQLDGETDWKLRISCPKTQSITSMSQLCDNTSLIVNPPTKSIHHFNGKLIWKNNNENSYPLTIDSTLWANTVLASGVAVGIIIYTGIDTRQAMNTTKSGVKTGLLELEINKLSKILCGLVFLLSVGLVLCHGWPLKKSWYIDIMRYLILFSSIIPVSLRVNLDLGKSIYAKQIEEDLDIEDTIVRTSTIPEDLGRIEYLLTDKTGTLTQNDMELKKLHLGTISYAGDTLDIVGDYVRGMPTNDSSIGSTANKKKDLNSKVCELVLTLALCHNVTPTYEEDSDGSLYEAEVTYQAASPDEIAIVKFIDEIGLKLIKRDRRSITLLHKSTNTTLSYEILYNFPFNSDTKRMGIVVKSGINGEVAFLEKGADSVMSGIVSLNDWLDEETTNMAREGLRTLVIGKKRLTDLQFEDFETNYRQASLSMNDRDSNIQRTISTYLENDLELLGVTGVEDKLQENVKTSIELLRNAGIKIWMLTGDKVETAKCIGISTRLIARGQYIHQIVKLTNNELALNQLEYLKMNSNCCLLIDGESLFIYLKYFKEEFFQAVIGLPSVIACRCTPQQKADIATLIKSFTGKRVCCIGDGGNDVSMIQAANVGVGIVGKEGKQASLSADFSIHQFYYLSKLLLWHGRNSYKRSSKLGQFIIHRGLLISICQAVFSITSDFEPLTLYNGFLMVGYATCYTMAPIFSMVLDCDVDEYLTKLYPELYKELLMGKSLSYKSFSIWCLISIYQGCIIQLMAQFFQENFDTMVTLSFSCLIFNELIMVALQINRWRKVMVATIVITLIIFIVSIPFLTEYFDLTYVVSVSYIWQVVVILGVSLFPVWLSQAINRRLNPPNYAKVQQV